VTFALLAVTLVAFAVLVAEVRARRTAEAATASERRLRSIALQAPELAMMLIDADHRYVMLEGVPFERSGVAPAALGKE